MVSGTRKGVELFFFNHVVSELLVHTVANEISEVEDPVFGDVDADDVFWTLFKECEGSMTAVDLHFLVFFRVFHRRLLTRPSFGV